MRCIWRHVGAYIMVWNGGRRIWDNRACEWRDNLGCRGEACFDGRVWGGGYGGGAEVWREKFKRFSVISCHSKPRSA